ncbi:MAG: endopeptidase La, partial [Deltaproteobacteria bacterium]|nr:endopeptidase La [Deltaproteobacteria bacterium]
EAPFDVGRPKSVRVIRAMENNVYPCMAVFAQKKPDVNDPGRRDLFPHGCVARVLKVVKRTSGTYTVFLRGVARIRLKKIVQTTPYLLADIHLVDEIIEDDVETRALHIRVRKMGKEALKLMPVVNKDVAKLIETVQEPGQVADLLASNLDIPLEKRVDILRLDEVKSRLRHVLNLMERQVKVLDMKARLHAEVEEEVGRSQREYVLRQQLKAIKQELGEGIEDDGDLDGLGERLREKDLPPEADEVARKQLRRLRGMQLGSPEFTTTLNYLDWILDLPWAHITQDNMDIPHVREILDEDHYGLEKIKRRMIEYLAVRKLKDDKKGPIICLVGPPGVGKTSLGRSISRALGRKFVRISLGGVHDEAAIRGHRRTYIGALPGKIIQMMKKAGSRNPVFMIDEIDKLGRDFRGDPAAALLEALDPDQNNTFSDHYLEIPFDLSQVIFMTTANQLEPIPPSLVDRMEVLEILGYTFNEKLAIARQYLLPKQIEEHGLTDGTFLLPDERIDRIVQSYTREAGVRDLERNLAAVCRAVAVEVAEEKLVSEKMPLDVDDELLTSYLGPRKYFSEIAERLEIPGVATSLVWTAFGGEIIFVEATRMSGKGNLLLTGRLGDVMKESARAAMSYMKVNARSFNLDPGMFEKMDIHIHVPAGAMPKDGPSAGLAMFAALASLLTGVKVRHDVAMTGEITLRGRVLPITGMKSKVLAAHRAGIKRIIVPRRNEPDLADVPTEVREGIEFVMVRSMTDALDVALEMEVLESVERREAPVSRSAYSRQTTG